MRYILLNLNLIHILYIIYTPPCYHDSLSIISCFDLYTDSTNKFFDIEINKSSSQFNCKFLNPQPGIKSCYVTITTGVQCDTVLQSVNISGLKSDLMTDISSVVNFHDTTTYCFSAIASDGNYSAIMELTYKRAGKSKSY